MHAENLSDDESIVTNLDDAVTPALETGWGLGDARRRDDAGRDGGESGVKELIFSRRQPGSA
jgi:hypothetical protein